MRMLPPWITAAWKRGVPLGVTSKLVAAFMLTNGTVVIGMVVFLHWNFGRAFLDYLSQTEVRHLDSMSTALAQPYATYGDGQSLRHNPRRWFHLLSEIYGRSTPDRNPRL